MKNNSKNGLKKFLSLLLVIILGCIFTIGVNAYAIWHNGLKSRPADVYIASHTTTNERNRAQVAMSNWNYNGFAYDCLYYAGLTVQSNYSVKDNMNCITRLSRGDPYNNATCFAVQTYYPGILPIGKFYMVEFDINMNADKTWYASTGTCPSTSYDFESIILHELGHALGLDEFPNQYYNGMREPMYGYTNAGEMHRTLTYDDLSGIFSLY